MLLFRLLPLGLGVGDHEARADRQCGELIDGIAAGAPVRKLLFVETLGHTRAPLAGYRPDHRAGVELAAIDAHRAAEAAADPEGRLAGGVAGGAGRPSSPPLLLGWGGRRGVQNSSGKNLQNGPASLCIAWREGGAYRL